MTPNLQSLVFALCISSLISLCLLILLIVLPRTMGFGWSFLLLLQLVNAYCVYRLYKKQVIKPSEILEYLKNTNL